MVCVTSRFSNEMVESLTWKSKEMWNGKKCKCKYDIVGIQ